MLNRKFQQTVDMAAKSSSSPTLRGWPTNKKDHLTIESFQHKNIHDWLTLRFPDLLVFGAMHAIWTGTTDGKNVQ